MIQHNQVPAIKINPDSGSRPGFQLKFKERCWNKRKRLKRKMTMWRWNFWGRKLCDHTLARARHTETTGRSPLWTQCCHLCWYRVAAAATLTRWRALTTQRKGGWIWTPHYWANWKWSAKPTLNLKWMGALQTVLLNKAAKVFANRIF